MVDVRTIGRAPFAELAAKDVAQGIAGKKQEPTWRGAGGQVSVDTADRSDLGLKK